MALTFPFSVDLSVRGYEIDSWGHVNNAVYLHWLEHARWEMGGPEGFGALGEGILPVVRHVELDYRAETLLGDTVRISLWPRRAGHSSFVLGCAIRVIAAYDKARVGKLATVATTAFTCIKRGEGKIEVPQIWRKYFPAEDPGDVLPPGV